MIGPSNLHILVAWTKSEDSADEPRKEVLIIEEEEFDDEDFSEYESFDIIDETEEDGWTPVGLVRKPSSLIKSWLSSSSESLPSLVPGWSSVKENVRTKVESFREIWDKRVNSQNQVLQRLAQDTVTSIWDSSSSTANKTSSECATPTRSNETRHRWPTFRKWDRSNGDQGHNAQEKQVELAPIRTSSSTEEVGINASLEGEDVVISFEDGSGDGDDCVGGQHDEFQAIPPPFPMRRNNTEMEFLAGKFKALALNDA